jgi:hypothetical protein
MFVLRGVFAAPDFVGIAPFRRGPTYAPGDRPPPAACSFRWILEGMLPDLPDPTPFNDRTTTS